MTVERIEIKVTRIAPNKYGVRAFYDGTLVVETTSAKIEISSAIKGVLRMLDKLGYDSRMASASRHRNNNLATHDGKFRWNR